MAKFTDVTQEYIDKAKPGNGSVTCGKGYNLKTHKDEIAVAMWLNTLFGGSVMLLAENTQHYGMKTPDFLWNGATWELKGIASDKFRTIDKRIKKACEQIRENMMWDKRGGIMLDFTGNALPMERIKKYVIKSAETRMRGMTDVIIRKGAEYVILRIKRE